MGKQIILADWAHCLSEQTRGSVHRYFSSLLLHANHPHFSGLQNHSVSFSHWYGLAGLSGQFLYPRCTWGLSRELTLWLEWARCLSPPRFSLVGLLIILLSSQAALQHGSWFPRGSVLRGQAPIGKCLSSLCLCQSH